VMRPSNTIERPPCRLEFAYQVGALHDVYHTHYNR
jgi:hypothetical protein